MVLQSRLNSISDWHIDAASLYYKQSILPEGKSMSLFMSLPSPKSLLQGEPATWFAELALANNGIAHIPGLPYVWVVSSPLHVEEILSQRPHDFDKGGAFYQTISRALGDGLFTTNNPVLWRRLHSTIQPLLQRHALQHSGVGQLTAQLWQSRMDGWNTGRPVIVFEELKQFSIELLAAYMFGVGVDAKRLAQLTTHVFAGMAGRLFLPQAVPGGQKYAQSVQALMHEIDEIIAAFRRQPTTGTMLSALLDARPAFTTQQIRDQIITILMAGHDSTATVLAWALVRLSEREGLYAELRDEARKTDNSELVRLVVQAAAHEHPAFPMFPRNVTRTTRLSHYEIPKGSQLLISLQAMHNNPHMWHGFDHFLKEATTGLSATQRRAHKPFGHGSRKCPGEAFAMQTAAIVLTLMLREFRFMQRHQPDSGERSSYHMTAPPRDGAAMWLVR